MTTPRLARLTSNWIAVREIQQQHDSTIIQLENPNKTHGSVITGVVEQVGPGKRYRGGLVVPVALQVGQTVWFEVEMGRARLPWDLDVRVMRETDVAGVVETPAEPCWNYQCPHYEWTRVNNCTSSDPYYPSKCSDYIAKEPVTPHPDDLSDAEAAAQNRLAPVRER